MAGRNALWKIGNRMPAAMTLPKSPRGQGVAFANLPKQHDTRTDRKAGPGHFIKTMRFMPTTSPA